MMKDIELKPLEITQNAANLFLSIRYAIDCRACREITMYEESETDLIGFAKRLNALGWLGDDDETALCPSCVEYFKRRGELE